MNKTNYDKLFLQYTQNLTKKQSLLLHSCCAPCSTLVIDRLKNYFDLTIFYYNPNMSDEEEYEKRKNEQIKYIAHLNQKGEDIKFVELGFCQNDYLKKTKELAHEKEGGKRCYVCYTLRLQETRDYASSHGFDLFCSTLSVSPYKNAEWLNEIGLKLQTPTTKWLPSDFKKREGYKLSRQMAREQNLYEQNYCGCIHSKPQQKNEEI